MSNELEIWRPGYCTVDGPGLYTPSWCIESPTCWACCHNIRKGARRFLVRFKGFGPAFDEWKEEADVSEVLVQAYDELCRRAGGEGGEVAKGAGMPRRQQTTAARGAEMPLDAQASSRGTRRSARLQAPRK